MDLSNTLHVFITFTGNFLEAFEKIFSSKQENLSEYSKLTLSFIFSKYQFLPFSWRIIYLVCRMVMLFLLTQRYNLSRLYRYFGCVHEAHQKVSGGIWKKSFSSIMSKKRSSKSAWNILRKPPVLSWNLFQMFLENFL